MNTLLKNRSYLYFVISVLLASLSRSFSNIALSWSLLQVKPTVELQAIFMLCLFLPSIILSPIIGVFTDCLDNKKMLIVARCIRLLGLTILVLSLPGVTKLVVYICSVIFGISIALNKNVFPIIVKKILKGENMQSGITLIDITDEIANMVGLATSSLLIGFKGTVVSIYFSLLLIVLSLIVSYMVKISHSPTVHLENSKISALRTLTNVWSLARSIALDTKLKYLYFLQAIFTACIATLPILLPVFIANSSSGSNIIQLGTLEALCALGYICGGMCILKFVNERNIEKVIPLGISAISSLIVLFIITECKILSYIIFTFIGFSLATYSLLISRTQTQTPTQIQGRAQAVFSSIETMLIVIANLFFSFYGENLNIKIVYLSYSLLLLSVSVLTKVFF